jgi:hypothetical protein
MSPDLRLPVRIVVAACAAALLPMAALAQVTPAPSAVRDLSRELACGPRAALTPPSTGIRIVGGAERGRTIFAIGDTVVINAGSAQGLQAGQEYFARREVHDRFAQAMSDKSVPGSIRTAGWVKLVEVRTDSAIATVVHACDGISDGDFLEPFVLPAVAPALVGGEPDFENPGRIVLGDERRQMGGPGAMMVLDRGSDHGIRPGQQLTIFRDEAAGGTIQRVGGATVLTVSPETSLVRIDAATDAVYVGDKVAIHRITRR